MFKITPEQFIAHPIHTSAFVVDFAVLLFMPIIRPPVVLSIILLCILVYLSMFFGAKLAVPESPKQPGV